jgi:hypothetical protein
MCTFGLKNRVLFSINIVRQLFEKENEDITEVTPTEEKENVQKHVCVNTFSDVGLGKRVSVQLSPPDMHATVHNEQKRHAAIRMCI